MILIHGLGASAERWTAVIPEFARKYRVIVPDLVGFGQSDKPPVDYTPAFFTDFVAKFIEGMRVRDCILVGSSLGGQIAVDFAAARQDLVSSLILVSPAGIMKHSTPALDAYIMAALYPNESTARGVFEQMEGSGRPANPNIVRGFVERMGMPNAKLAFMSTLLGLKNSESVEAKLESIMVPTMLIWGTRDPMIPVEYADDFLACMPGCVLYKMDGCGHTPYVQEPERFAAAVLDFLDERAAAGESAGSKSH